MTTSPVITFPGWTPDRVNLSGEGVTEAMNVIPTVDGFRPLNSFTRYSSTALTGHCRGVITVKSNDGNVHFYVGDKTKLYKMLDTSFTNASSSVSGTYDLGASNVWEFVRFGQRVITNSPDFNHQPQQTTLGSLTFSTALITSTDQPKMKHIAALRDFVVGGNISSTAGGLTPARVWWSSINDPTNWSPNRTTQCDYQDLEYGGAVQRIIGSVEYAVVFQENVIRRMNYTGSPKVFDIDVVDRRRGTLIPTSVVNWGRFVFYISPEGFMAFDGVESTPIGENKVDDEFYRWFNIAQANEVHSAVDPVLKNVYWSYPGEGNTGHNNTILVYHWPEKKWSHLNQALPCIGNMGKTGYTLEGLDAISTSMDNDALLGPSLDADKWKGTTGVLGGFDDSNFLGFFDGAPEAAVIDSQEVQLSPGKRSQVNAVRPLIQTGTRSAVVASIGHRKALVDTPTFSSGIEMNQDGLCMQRVEDRYHRARFSLTSSVTWSLFVGMQLDYEETGDR